jgi:hypothetical protein
MNFFKKKEKNIQNLPNNTQNSQITSANFFSNGKLVFKCPNCGLDMSVKALEIAPVAGSFVLCKNCKNIAHVPSGYQTDANPVDLKITGSVQVPMSKFADWYFENPLIVSLIESGLSDFLTDYGLWAFCSKCYHQYKSTVLVSLPISQRAGGFFFNANSAESADDMNSLRSGHCPSCGNDYLLVIAAEIPDYVRGAIHDAKG